MEVSERNFWSFCFSDYVKVGGKETICLLNFLCHEAGSVSDDYLDYMLLQFPTNVTGWICHTLVTSSLLKVRQSCSNLWFFLKELFTGNIWLSYMILFVHLACLVLKFIISSHFTEPCCACHWSVKSNLGTIRDSSVIYLLLKRILWYWLKFPDVCS